MENKQIKILAIDDNFDNLTTIEALIVEAIPHATVFLANSGLEGLEKAASELPDVILLDIIMPIMDGYEVCRELKSNSNLSDIPVVFVTALQGNKESRILGLEVGAEAFLSKPIDQSELVAQIRAMLKIKQAIDYKQNQNEYLSILVEEKTKELKAANVSTLNLLEDIQNQIESRILIEQSLRESEEKYRFMAENTSDVIWHLDNNFSFDYVSPAIEQMQGYKPEELIGKHLFSIMSDDGIRQIQEVSSGVAEMQLKGKLPKEMKFEYEAICKDGSRIWVEVNVSIHFDNEMKPAGFHGVTRDISERKKDELALLQSEEKYRSLVENSPNGIAIYQEGKFVFVNKPGVEMLGGSDLSDFIGKSVLSTVHPDSMDLVLKRSKQISQGTKLPPIEEKLLRLDGSFFYAQVSSLEIIFNGKPAIQSIVADITEQKSAAERLKESEEKFRDMSNLLPQVVFEIHEQPIIF